MIRFLLAAILAAMPVLANAGTLVPHRAVYEISFKRAGSETQFVGGAGKWVTELKGSVCSGYDAAYRIVTRLDLTNNRSLLVDTRGTTFENGEGTAFNFSNTTFRNNKLIEEVEGAAARKSDHISVKLSKPEVKSASLPDGVIFPAQHLLKIITGAKAGERLIKSRVFEGVEGASEAFDTVVLVLDKNDIVADLSGDQPYKVLEDQKVKHWPIRVSYYKPDSKQDAVPEWQNSFVIYENGIGRSFEFDYGDLVLSGKMTSLEFLPEEEC